MDQVRRGNGTEQTIRIHLTSTYLSVLLHMIMIHILNTSNPQTHHVFIYGYCTSSSTFQNISRHELEQTM